MESKHGHMIGDIETLKKSAKEVYEKHGLYSCINFIRQHGAGDLRMAKAFYDRYVKMDEVKTAVTYPELKDINISVADVVILLESQLEMLQKKIDKDRLNVWGYHHTAILNFKQEIIKMYMEGK